MPELQNGSTVEPVNAEFWLAVVFSHDLGEALGILSSPLRCQTIVRVCTLGQAKFFGGDAKTGVFRCNSKGTFLEATLKESCDCVDQVLSHWDVFAFVLLLKLIRAVPSQEAEAELLEAPGCSGNNLKANATLPFDILTVWGMQWVSVGSNPTGTVLDQDTIRSLLV